MAPKRYTFEGNNGAFTVQFHNLDSLIALAQASQRENLPYRIYTSEAEGGYGDTGQGWHDGLTEAERETLHEAGVEW